MPAQLEPGVDEVTEIGAEWNFVESAVDVAVTVTEFAPVLAGVNVTAVPDLTAVVALSEPADAGLIERFTVLMKTSVPVTVGVHEDVWALVIDDGLQVSDTAVMTGDAGAVMAIFAVPSFAASAVEVAFTLSKPEAGTVEGAV
jgi:hypothetical protein